MTEEPYVPERGDLVWLTFDPQAGVEQAGRRPALVMSPARYNRAVGLMLACPVTSQRKGYAFEVLIPPGTGIRGVVLADHVKSVDWRARGIEFIAAAPPEAVADTLDRILGLLMD